jgi:hypothetical protein
MYDGDKEADPQVWGHVVVREPAPREDGDGGASPRVRGHVAAREPTVGPRTRGGTGARPAGAEMEEPAHESGDTLWYESRPRVRGHVAVW